MSQKLKKDALVTDWLEEDNMMLLKCWARDGYTYQDIANKIGISINTLRNWRDNYPEINEALKHGREIIDYKVENALLKSALGYKTKEVKVTTIMRHGNVVETQREVLSKEQAPNVSACQCWLYNRLPDKWKKNRDQIIDVNDEDTTIQVTVTRAGKNSPVDEETNTSIKLGTMSEEEQAKKKKEKKAKKTNSLETKVEIEAEDRDYWPDDFDEESWDD